MGPLANTSYQSPEAISAFLIGAVVAIPIALLNAFSDAAPFAWFIGTALAGASYLLITALTEESTEPAVGLATST